MNTRKRVLFVALILTGFLAAAAQVSGQETFRYSILGNKTIAGIEVETYGADGKIDSEYEYNDRGRGPKITAHYIFNSEGYPVRVDITGNDYLKGPVDEHFSVEDGRAKWKSTTEEGSAEAGGFYLSNNGGYCERAWLVALLIKAKGRPVKLLPAGEARLQRLGETTLEKNGKSIHVTEYAVTGLEFEPYPVWLDDELKFFAVAGPWFPGLREGWEDSNQKLYGQQTTAAGARYEHLAKELARKPSGPVAIEHVRLFDAEKATVLTDQTVVIEGERVKEVGPASAVKVPENAERIDGTGRTLVPGLFDMHAHLGPLDGLFNIASGVTGARDMANDIDALTRLQKQWDSGEVIGPRVWKAGFIDGPGPFRGPGGILVSTPEEAKAAVNRYADTGHIQIKLYSSLNPELVPGIVKLAHERGLRVSGHVPNGLTARQFVEEGADEIQHINFIFLNFLADKVKDTRTPERFTAVGAYAAKLDLESQPVKDFIELLLVHHTTVDVTMATFEGMFTGRPGRLSPDYEEINERLPAQIQRKAYGGGLPVTAETDQLYKDSYAAMLKMTKKMYDAGVPILAGTDNFPGLMLHRELELEVKAGIPPAKALQIATWNAAKLLKQEKELGSIAAGKKADLVLVEGNPAEKISDIRRCRMVMKNGTVYKSDDVYAAVGIKRAN